MSNYHGRGRNPLRAMLVFLILCAAVVGVSGSASAATQYPADCTDCHSMPPLDEPAGERDPDSGAFKGNHQTHAGTISLTCVKCHGPRALTYETGHRTSLIQGAWTSINGSPRKTWYSRGFFNQTSVPPNPLGTCSNVNCHFETTTPAWGGARLSGEDDCATCHNDQTASAAHAPHLARYGAGAATCARCHPDHLAESNAFAHASSAGQPGRTIAVTAGTYTGGNASFLPSQSATRTLGSCTAVYCHSPGQNATGGPLGAADYASPNWGDPASGACGTCHAAGKATLASGSHRQHLSQPSVGCNDCHVGAAADGSSYASERHLNRFINVTGAYSKGSQHAPGSGYGTCSSATCHDNGLGVSAVTPQWGSSTPKCTACHAAQPATGSHSVHLTVARAVCADCHNGAVQGASPSADHLNGMIDVYNTVQGDLGYSSPKPKGSEPDSCSSTRCHDDGTGNLKDSPIWGSHVADCTACHERQPRTGSHPAHLGSPNITCASCHFGAVEAATAPPQHLDGNVDVYRAAPGDLGYPVDKAKGSAYTSCSTASCHRDGSLQQIASGVWGTPAAERCGACHAARPSTGSHQAHFDAGFTTCGSCHQGAVDGSNAPAGHVNGVLDVYASTPGDLGYPAAKGYNTPPATCNAASCHDDGRGNLVASPTWGSHVANCSACHATRPATGSHTPHLNVGLTCAGCHKGAVEGQVAPVEHMDNNVDVYKSAPGDLGYPRDKAKGSAYTSCSASACHGTLSKPWGTVTANFQCTKCHGMGTPYANYSSDNRQAAPGYGGTGVGTGQQTGTLAGNVSSDPKVGAHDTHLRSLNNVGRPAACSDCHKVPAVVFISGHMNGQTDMVWSNLVQNKETVPGSQIPYTFGSGAIAPGYAAGQCSNTYCHGATMPGGVDKTPSWTDGGYLTGERSHDCNQCHGYPPTTSTRRPHSAGETDCAQCHPHNGSRDSTDPLLGRDYHINGKIEATNFCDTCHDYDTRGTNGSLWGKNPMAVEGFGAHAMHINYLKGRMGAVTLDPNADAFGQGAAGVICGTCHTNIAANHEQYNWKAPRKLTFGESTARQFGSNPPQYNGVTGVSSAVTLKTCSNIDCHYKTSPIWQPF